MKLKYNITKFSSLLLIGLIAGCQNYEQVSKQKGTLQEENLCNQFEEAFKDVTYKVSKEDSLAAYNFRHAFHKTKPYSLEPPFKGPDAFVYTYRMKYLNQPGLFMESEQTFHNYKNIFKYKDYEDRYFKKYGVSYPVAHYVLNSDATFIGTVIHKDNFSDTCLLFKTTYIVRVDSILNSYFPLKKGDNVIIKSNAFGFEGGCSDGAGKRIFMTTSHILHYEVNDSAPFFITKSGYVRLFNQFIVTNTNFKDEYCYNSFMDQGYDFVNNLLLNSDKEKFNQFLHQIKNTN
jgi:hypothetical protein